MVQHRAVYHASQSFKVLQMVQHLGVNVQLWTDSDMAVYLIAVDDDTIVYGRDVVDVYRLVVRHSICRQSRVTDNDLARMDMLNH